VVVVMQVGADTWVGIMAPYSLEIGQRVSKYPEPVVLCECGESRVDGYQFRSHGGAGLLRTNRIHVDGGAGGYMYHRRS